ncbi:MAG: MFS transporter [Negativicutes bacterium]|jgi:MFS family permease
MFKKLYDHPLYLYPNFRNFFIGDVLVAVAERYFAITFAWWIISQDGENGKWLGLLMAVEAIPILCLSPFVGPIIDRYNKKWCMLIGATAQLFFVTIIWLLMQGDALQFTYLVILSFCMSCFVPQFEDSISASVGSLVDEKHLSQATTIQSTSIEFSNIFAAVISASMIAAFGIAHAVLFNLALYVVGVLFLFSIKTELLRPVEENDSEEDDEDEESGESSNRYLKDLKKGLKYIASNRPLYLYAIVYALETFFTVPIFILIPMLVKGVLHETINWVAVFETSLSIGSVLTAVVLSFKSEFKRFYPTYAVVAFCMGAFMIALGFATNGYLMAGLIFFMGGLFATMMAMSFMMFQYVVPQELKGRFFGVMSTIAAGMAPLSYMTVGLLSDIWSTEAVLILDGIGAALLGIYVLTIPRLRESIEVVEDVDY